MDHESYDIISTLPKPEDIVAHYPPNVDVIAGNRLAFGSILRGEDPRFIANVGPCSAYPRDPALRFMEKLARLQERVSERILCVGRFVIQKPRTRGRDQDWKGPVNRPHPKGAYDLHEGMHFCAEMMQQASSMVAINDEMLFTQNGDTFDPYLSGVWLGARTSGGTELRGLASRLTIPVGVKHDTYGNVEQGVNGVEAVQTPQDIPYKGMHVHTHGAKLAYLILRGGTRDKKVTTNYDAASIAAAAAMLTDAKKYDIQNPAIIVDASHDNCNGPNGKDPRRQMEVIASVIDCIIEQREGFHLLKGGMAECFDVEGFQSVDDPNADHSIGKSFTDPCMGWGDTERMILQAADRLDTAAGRMKL